MKNEFEYTLDLTWLGDENGKHHRHDRFYEIAINGKPKLSGSADKPFFGDPKLYNPEDLLLSALSSCHMMSFLYLCRKKGLQVKLYKDKPLGILKVNSEGHGKFESVTLKPSTEFVNPVDKTKLEELHSEAGKLCFIANSVNFQIDYEIN